jgi:hypothetical protein
LMELLSFIKRFMNYIEKKLNGVIIKIDFENSMIRLSGLSFNKFSG